jgi:surface protein
VVPTSAFNINIGSWNTARATTMEGMFYQATTFNQDISRWNVASVTSFSSSGYGMFGGASAFDQNIASWNVLRVTSFTANFDSTTALSSCNKGAIYAAWGATFQAAWPTLNYACTVGSVACAMCITNGNIGAAVTAWVTNPTTAATTYGDIVEWNTAAVSCMASLFSSKPTFNGDIGKWNFASVSNMAGMFKDATAFNQDISSWNVASVSNMDEV